MRIDIRCDNTIALRTLGQDTPRGQAVLGYLISRGVAVTRLQAVSYGELFPEAGTDLGISRRIEFEVAP